MSNEAEDIHTWIEKLQDACGERDCR